MSRDTKQNTEQRAFVPLVDTEQNRDREVTSPGEKRAEEQESRKRREGINLGSASSRFRVRSFLFLFVYDVVSVGNEGK